MPCNINEEALNEGDIIKLQLYKHLTYILLIIKIDYKRDYPFLCKILKSNVTINGITVGNGNLDWWRIHSADRIELLKPREALLDVL
jgi:hypothetical protein